MGLIDSVPTPACCDWSLIHQAKQSLEHEQTASANNAVVGDGGDIAPTAPSAIIDQGQSSTLSWNSTDATDCTADRNASIEPYGSEAVAPSATTTYAVTCTWDGGSVSDSVTMTVNPPTVMAAPTVSITSSPTRLARGGTITLSNSSTGASTCMASGGWSGSRPVNGAESVVINDPATYTLPCTGAAGSASQAVSYRAWGRRFLYLR